MSLFQEAYIKICIKFSKDNRQERVETCRGSNALIVKSLCCMGTAVAQLVEAVLQVRR